MLTTILGAVGGIAAIVTACYGVFKWITWKFQTTPEQADQDIDSQEQANKQKAEETGRPQ